MATVINKELMRTAEEIYTAVKGRKPSIEQLIDLYNKILEEEECHVS